jgi:acyl-homoserine-lactone acylase
LYPQLQNPPSGFLQNCNNPPWAVTKDSGIQPLEPVTYYLRERPQANPIEMLNARGERLLEVLSEEGKFTPEDMQRLAFDTYVTPADVIVPLLQNAYADQRASEGQNGDPRIMRALDLIKAWDRRSSASSAAYTYIYFWGKAYEGFSNGVLFSRFLGHSRRKIAIHSREEQALARRALEMAVDRIEKDFGKSEVPWGEVNVSLRGRPFPMDGTGLYDVLHPDDGPTEKDGRIHSNDGWGHMMIVMEGNPKQVWTLLPYGESEHPSSPHFNDQTKLHSRQQLKAFWFRAADIQAHIESVRGRRNRIAALIRRQESSGVAQR